MNKLFCRVILIWFIAIGVAVAQNVTLNSTVSKSEIYIGDRFEYEISVSYPDSSRIELPGVIGNLGTFEVKEHQVTEPISKDGLTTETWILNLSTFLSGEFVIPPQVVEFYQQNDTNKTILYTEPIKIKVLNRNTEDVTDIIDVEAVADMPLSRQTWIIIIVGSLVALTVIILIMLRIRRKTIAAVVLPPYEEAKKNLKVLQNRKLMETGAYKDHFFELTEILKLYISRRFGVDATEATTSELLERVTVISEIEGELKEMLPEFCEQTDLIKFAKMTLETDKNELLNQYVEEFVEQTKPPEGEAVDTKETEGES